MRGMRFRCSESTGFAALYSGNERASQRAFKRVVRPGDNVIDAGANWGLHTLYLARLVGLTGSVHAFEPHPLVFEELQWHVRNNSLHQVRLHQRALLDTSGTAAFVLSHNTKASHIAGVDEPGSPQERVSVPYDSLDSMVEAEGLESVRLIKIDVEGAESSVLRGAAKTIARFHPDLVIELHSPTQDLEVAGMLTRWDYTLSRVDGPTLLYVDRSWPEVHGVWGTVHATWPKRQDSTCSRVGRAS
jgi:FkbM family methyltransferase